VTLRTTSHGSWITPAGLRPGSYGLRCAPPAGYEPWERHTTPAQGVLNVTEGHTSSAFVMFRRAPVEVTVNQGTIHYFRYQVCNDRRCLAPKVRSTFARRFEQYDTKALDVRFQPIPSPYGRLPLPGAVTASAGASVSLHPGLYTNTVLAGSDQYYLYVGERMSTELGVEFGAPISWFYVHPDGTVDSGPADGAGSGLWMVRWYCHEGDSPIQMACPEGRVPEGRGPLRLGGSGGDGAA
jgi:hypothetical protein